MSNGNHVAAPRRVRVRSFFVYPVPVTAVAAAGGVGTATVRIESATDFHWIKAAWWADNTTAPVLQTEATRQLPAIDVQIQLSGSDRNLFNAPVPITSVFGTGELPFVLPFPMILIANSDVRFNFVNREPANAFAVRCALIGWKDFGELIEQPGPGA